MSDKRTQFDKFMDDIVKKESVSSSRPRAKEEDLKRKRVRLYQERWQNQVRYNRAQKEKTSVNH